MAERDTETDYKWAIPVMRAGYAGRGVTYLAVAGLSLWAIWHGGEAQGTGSALRSLGDSTWGVVVLWLIAIGLVAYAIWRGLDAIKDLEDYGTEAKGLVARAGMVVTGLVHGVIAGLALSIVFGRSEEDGGRGGVSSVVARVLELPGGRWILAFAALATIGAGIYYVIKGWKAKYREKLAANRFTGRYDWALRAGVIANGVIILVVGGFLGAAAWAGTPEKAGGMGKVFDWLASQPFGNVLVIVLCLGLLGFAFFCFVNAAYRIVEKVPHDDLESLARRRKREMEAA
ncbi:DUF1206 domain-containing protein [Jannaschia sp. W003]|uniref:DUF1206 domain-containing protein n=1 Tax=Jannaschia sp. W003 TaxID=2867012 RepID=UPI0021A309FA|nr:DUF1206 domain-containing protein [Jannaschia sp. W003]UWQ20451.1 DUF1206 domain-containing protein [Jannaschia sp. W003]